MDRRTLLQTAGVAGLVGATAGCMGLNLTSGEASSRAPPVVEDRPDGVYLPSHVEGMQMGGTNRGGDYRVAVTYSYPHRFWNINGTAVQRTDIQQDDDVHLMSVVWDPETGMVIPETGLSVEILKAGDLVSQEVIYPMLSQPMGFHYGANFGLAGDGTYTVRLTVGAVRTRRTGAFQSRFGDPATIDVALEYSERRRNEIRYELLEDAGTRGAVPPMDMGGVPAATLPNENGMPGTVVGQAKTDDAILVARRLADPPAGVDADGEYIAVSAHTPYNKMLLPAMGVEAQVTREGTTVFEGELIRTLDPDLSYHYGTVVDTLEPGDKVTLTPAVQPQVARHEGYETAFGGLQGGMTSMEIAVQ